MERINRIYQIDGKKVYFFKEEITMRGDVTYQFSDNLKSGQPTHELKQSQFREMVEVGRIQ